MLVGTALQVADDNRIRHPHRLLGGEDALHGLVGFGDVTVNYRH